MFAKTMAVLVLASIAFVASAPVVKGEEAAVQLKEVIVTATRTEKSPQDVTQTVTVITGMRSTGQALRPLPRSLQTRQE